MANNIERSYLTPNYEAVAATINMIHNSNYTNRHIKHIHKGRHKRTQNTIKIEIESIVGSYSNWFDADGKKRYQK